MERRTIITPDQRLRVFVSSTIQELAEERAAVTEAVKRLRLSPVLFELGARPHPAQELYRAYLDQSDIFIGIYWQSYGWVGPGMEISGLEDEFLLSDGMPRLIYVKTPAPDQDPRLKAFLTRIRDTGGVSYKDFSSADQLGEFVQDDLALLLTEGFAGSRSGREPREPTSPAARAPTHRRLPIPPAAIFGREDEIATLSDLLFRPDVSLVTLTGPGGAGKTRLVLEVARLLENRFPDGVVFASLEALEDPDLVAATLNTAFGLPEAPGGRPEDLLVAYLATRRLLLVLDNFEHVVDAAGLIAEFLEAAPDLKILITSRSPLRLRWEKEFPVGPLACPPPGVALGASELETFPALMLLLERSRDARLDCSLTEVNIDAMSEICRRLDGLPLALELAAARSRLLSPPELLQRLHSGIDLLAADLRDLPERQRTLGATIDWSYRLLGEPAQTLFRRLSVFAGGWTLDAAETVCAGPGETLDLISGLEALIEASLVQRREEPGLGLRFAMLQTVREFAVRKLAADPEEKEAVAGRHAAWVVDFAERAADGMISAERAFWTPRLDREIDNIRAALSWCASSGHVEPGIGIVWRLLWFWELRSAASEALFWLDALDERLHEAAPSFRARSHLSRIFPLFMRRDVDGMQEAVARARAELEGADDREGLANLLQLQGMILATTGHELAASEHLLRQAMGIFSSIGRYWEAGVTGYWLAFGFLVDNQVDESSRAATSAAEFIEKTGDSFAAALVALIQGCIQVARGDFSSARGRLEDAAHNLGLAGDLWAGPWATAGLGLATVLARDPLKGEKYSREGLLLGRDYSNLSAVTLGLAGLAGAALTCAPCADGKGPDPPRAARLLGAVATRAAASPMLPWPRPSWDKAVGCLEASVRAALDEATFEREFAVGQRLSDQEALAYALAE